VWDGGIRGGLREMTSREVTENGVTGNDVTENGVTGNDVTRKRRGK